MRKLLIGITIAVMLIVGVLVVYRQMKDKLVPIPSLKPTSQSYENTEPADNQTNNVLTETNEVEIKDNTFTPSNITVKRGSKVTWINKDVVAHTVTSENNSKLVFDSLLLEKDQSYSFTFNKLGAFGYYCQSHPSMTGTVTVIE